jgi:hypothetical protein
MWDSFTDHSTELPSLDVEGNFRWVRRARRTTRCARWFMRQREANHSLTPPEQSHTPVAEVSNRFSRSPANDRASLSARVKQLYDDFEAVGGHPVGESVADVYNALLRDMTNTFEDGQDELKGFRQITRDATGESVRLLVGQLRLIADDE